MRTFLYPFHERRGRISLKSYQNSSWSKQCIAPPQRLSIVQCWQLWWYSGTIAARGREDCAFELINNLHSAAVATLSMSPFEQTLGTWGERLTDIHRSSHPVAILLLFPSCSRCSREAFTWGTNILPLWIHTVACLYIKWTERNRRLSLPLFFPSAMEQPTLGLCQHIVQNHLESGSVLLSPGWLILWNCLWGLSCGLRKR